MKRLLTEEEIGELRKSLSRKELAVLKAIPNPSAIVATTNVWLGKTLRERKTYISGRHLRRITKKFEEMGLITRKPGSVGGRYTLLMRQTDLGYWITHTTR